MCTKVKELHERLCLMSEKESIENFLIYTLSIVIAGTKPAATITLKKTVGTNYDKWNKYGAEFIKSIGLKFITLRESDKSIILLIYNEALLSSYIFNHEHYEFLVKLGYSEEKSLDKYMNKLKERYEMYKCPHELGIFLGFPIDDVIDFMECTEKRCLLCGYWRVYNNFNEAKDTFKRFDIIKSTTASSILKGRSSFEIVNYLRSESSIIG